MRASISGRSTITPTATLPGVSLYATAGVRPRIIEVGIWNTGAAAAVFAINRLSSTGTQGAGLTEVADSVPEEAIISTGFAGHTVAPTLGGEVKRCLLGAGAGVIYTWEAADALVIAAATTNGIGIITPTGTGQVFDYSISWIE